MQVVEVVYRSTYRDWPLQGLTMDRKVAAPSYKAAQRLIEAINRGRYSRDSDGRRIIDHHAMITH